MDEVILQRLECMEEKVKALESDLKIIEAVLEKEVWPNIVSIAKRHARLFEDISDVMQAKAELLVLAVKMNLLEASVMDIKGRIS
ncbi:MAG: hypothetical protein IJZ82_08565 [Lachnospiraceae bacterium]|nr:hypothetical protein [Lachnospiraceae bacterium]